MQLSKRDVSQIRSIVRQAKDAYYNSGKFLRLHTEDLPVNVAALILHGKLMKGKARFDADVEVNDKRVEITDSVYDVLEAALREFAPDAPELKQVRTTEKMTQAEVKLPYLMPSLDKKFYGEGTLAKWMAKNPGPYIIMDKLDGVSMELLWQDGVYDRLYKGGSATHGLDWSYAIPHLKLPRRVPAGDGGVRAELIMSKAEFLKKWKGKYKNARNLTSGIVNKTRGIHEAIGSIEPIVFDVLHKRMKPSAALKWAEQQGFKTVRYITATNLSEDKLLRYLRTREKADHMIDGLVIAVDKPFALTRDNPKTMIAFKAASEGNYAETRITEIEWRPSRHGRLVPRFTVEPVELAGVTVTHATAHNAKYVVDNKINVGSVVGIVRSGEVIPYVEKVIKPSKSASMPDKSVVGDYKWDANKTHLLLADAKRSDTSRIKAIAHFFAAGLEVDGMGIGVAKQLYEAGYDTVRKIVRMKPEDYMRIEGWKEKKSNNVYNGIRQALKAADPIKVMAASGLFGALIGTRKLEALRAARPKLFNFDHVLTQAEIQRAIEGVPGFKDKSARPIIENLSRFSEWISKLPITFKKPEVLKVSGSKMKGQVVVFTGFRDEELGKEIARQGGTVGSAVNSKTTLLVAKDVGALRGKGDKAKALGIKIISREHLLQRLGM